MSIKPTSFSEILLKDYLNYSLSVVRARAIPDIRDGLKPVQRRILYAMLKAGFKSDTQYRKSARVVGEALGKFHPHSDGSVYDAIVLQAQDFTRNIPLIDGQGNFGSRGSDGPAAMRYTECKLSKFAEEVVLADLKKRCVDFMPNFDSSLEEPVVLPTKIPLTLLNGNSGVAVGFASSCPPHNLNEIIDALIALLKGEKEEKLVEYLKGPDFPTKALIKLSKEEWRNIFFSGRGSIKVFAKYKVENAKNRKKIIFYELPYQINIDKIAEKIEALKKKYSEILSVRDESDLNGVSIAVEVSKKADIKRVIAVLYKFTELQSSVSYLLTAIDESKPRLVSIPEYLKKFIEFRIDTLNRYLKIEREEVEKNLKIKKVIRKALDFIDDIIQIIKESKNYKEALESLKTLLRIDEESAEIILNIRISRLTRLETEKLEKEIDDLEKRLEFLNKTIDNEAVLKKEIIKELKSIKKKYGYERRTQFMDEEIEESNILTKINKKLVAEKLSIGITEDLKVCLTQKPGSFYKSYAGLATDYVLFRTSKNEIGKFRLGDLRNFKEGSKLDVRELVPELKDDVIDIYEKDIVAFLVLSRKGEGRIVSAKSCIRGDVEKILQTDHDYLFELKEADLESTLTMLTNENRIARIELKKLKPVSKGAKAIPLMKTLDSEIIFAHVGLGNILIEFEKGYKGLKIEDIPIKGRNSKGIIAFRVPKKAGKIKEIKLTKGLDPRMCEIGKSPVSEIILDQNEQNISTSIINEQGDSSSLKQLEAATK